MALHTFIKTQREKKGFSQAQVANHLHCTRQTYSFIETGKKSITLDEGRKLAALFEIPFEAFITEKVFSHYTVELETIRRKETGIKQIRISVPQSKVAMFKEVLLYILEKVGAQPNVGLTVLYKLLYFIDFDYYERYEEQFIGARYQKNMYGPTPIEFKKITERMVEEGEIEQVKSKYFTRDQVKFLPHRTADLTKLTARHVKHIDEVLGRLARKNASELSEYSHKDVPWIMAKEGEEIQYEAVFYRTHETTVRNYDD